MSDLQRLQDAFLKADALAQEGNEQARQDAQLFADEIRRLQSSDAQPSRGRVANNSAIGQFNKSVASALDVLRTPSVMMDRSINAGTDLLFGRKFIPDAKPTADIFRAMDIAVADRPPETVMEGLGAGAGAAVTAYAPIVGGLNALRAATTNPTAIGVIDDALRALSGLGGLGAEAVAGAASGAAGRGAEQAGRPELANIAEIVGGGVALPAAIATGRGAANVAGQVAVRTPGAGTAIQAARDARMALTPMTDAAARDIARSELQRQAGGPERAADLAEMIKPLDEFGRTAGQQTGDPNLLGLERSAAAEDPVLRERLAERTAASQEAITGAVQELGGDVGDARQFLRSRVNDFSAAMDERVDRIIMSADGSVQSAGSGRSEIDTSTSMVDRLRAELDVQRAQERDLWQAVPSSVMVETASIKAAAQAMKDSNTKFQAGDVPPVINQILGNEVGDTEPLSELHGAYSELRRVARVARAGDTQNRNMARMADNVADAIIEQFDALDIEGPGGAAIAEARAFTRVLNEKFRSGTVGRILARTNQTDARISPEAAMGRTVGRGGAEGMVGARDIDNAAPDASQDVQDYLRTRFVDAIERGVGSNGKFNATQARNFLRSNAETLNRYPELKGDLRKALASKDAAQAFAIRSQERVKLAERGPIADFATGRASDAVTSIIGADNPAKAARSIVAAARKDQTGAALAGVKGAFTDYLTKDTSKLPALIADPQVAGAMGRVFSSAEMKRLRGVSKAMQTLNAPAREVGPTMEPQTGMIMRTIVRVAGAQTGSALGKRMPGANTAGTSLQAAQLGASNAERMLNRLTASKAQEIIHRAIVDDPALYRELLMTPAGWANGVGKSSRSRLAAYLSGSTAPLAEDEN